MSSVFIFWLNFYANLNLLFVGNLLYSKDILKNQEFFSFIFENIKLGNQNTNILIGSLIVTIIYFGAMFILTSKSNIKPHFIFEYSLLITLFYILKINSLSRVTILIFLLYVFLESKISIKNLKYLVLFKVILILFLFGTNSFSNPSSNEELEKIEEFDFSSAQSCLNTFGKEEVTSEKEYYVIGHAYGNHTGLNEGLSESILDYFSQKNENIILTGDIVRSNNSENLKIVKNQLSKRFNNVYISVGNHDLSKEFYEEFEEDLHLISEKGVDFVIANFSTESWLPNLEDQEKINNFLEISNNEIIIMFSHQLFWVNLINNEITPNGFDLLNKELKANPFDWMNLQNKKLIVVSGDYGIEASFFCRYLEDRNIVLVANGIYDNVNDKILKIATGQNSYSIEIFNLNN